MAPISAVYLVKFFIICASMSSLVDSISLTTTRPRTRLSGSSKASATLNSTKPASDTTNSTKLASAPPLESASASLTTTTTKSPSGLGFLYRLRDRTTKKTCVLLRTDAVVEVNFILHTLPEQVDSFIPVDAVVKGNCDSDDQVTMDLTWQWHALSLTFAKTPGGERWYLTSVELIVSLDRKQLSGIQTRDKTLRLISKEMLMMTPVGTSYSCEEVDIDLQTDPDDSPPKDVHGSLLLRKLQVQAFMHRADNFSEPYFCRAEKYFRSETAPIAVGTTLAIAALGMVSGYSAYRYFKVKKVQYNAME